MRVTAHFAEAHFADLISATGNEKMSRSKARTSQPSSRHLSAGALGTPRRPRTGLFGSAKGEIR